MVSVDVSDRRASSIKKRDLARRYRAAEKQQRNADRHEPSELVQFLDPENTPAVNPGRASAPALETRTIALRPAPAVSAIAESLEAQAAHLTARKAVRYRACHIVAQGTAAGVGCRKRRPSVPIPAAHERQVVADRSPTPDELQLWVDACYSCPERAVIRPESVQTPRTAVRKSPAFQSGAWRCPLHSETRRRRRVHFVARPSVSELVLDARTRPGPTTAMQRLPKSSVQPPMSGTDATADLPHKPCTQGGSSVDLLRGPPEDNRRPS